MVAYEIYDKNKAKGQLFFDESFSYLLIFRINIDKIDSFGESGHINFFGVGKRERYDLSSSGIKNFDVIFRDFRTDVQEIFNGIGNN